MSPTWQFDDDAVEAIIRGEATDASIQRLSAFVRHVRAAGKIPAPRPSTELAALLQGNEDPGLRPVAAPTPSSPSRSSAVPGRARRSKRRHRVPIISAAAGAASKIASLGLAGKIALGAGAATAGLTAAGATGVAPAPITDPVQGAIEAVTPLEFGGSGDATVTADPNGAGAEANTPVGGAEADASTDVVGGATGAATGAAGAATGAAGEAVDTAEETVGDVQETVDETVDNLPVDVPEPPVDPTLPPVPTTLPSPSLP